MGIPFFLTRSKTAKKYEDVDGVRFLVLPGGKPGENALTAEEQICLDEVAERFEPAFSQIASIARKIATEEHLTHTHAFAAIVNLSATQDGVFDWLSSRDGDELSPDILEAAGFTEKPSELFENLKQWGFCNLQKDNKWLIKLPSNYEAQRYKASEIRVKYSADIARLNQGMEKEEAEKRFSVATVAIRSRCYQALEDDLSTASDEEKADIRKAIDKIKSWTDTDTKMLPISYVEKVYKFLESQRTGGLSPSKTGDEITEEELKKAIADPDQTGEPLTGESGSYGRRKKSSATTTLVASQSG